MFQRITRISPEVKATITEVAMFVTSDFKHIGSAYRIELSDNTGNRSIQHETQWKEVRDAFMELPSFQVN